MASHFQVFVDNGTEFRWRLLADNNRTIAASSEGYKQRTDALNGIELVRRSEGRFEVYKDSRQETRWRFVHSNGRIIATAGESYKEQRDAEAGIDLVRRLAPIAQVKDHTLPPHLRSPGDAEAPATTASGNAGGGLTR